MCIRDSPWSVRVRHEHGFYFHPHRERPDGHAEQSLDVYKRQREIVHRMQPVWELLHMEDILFEYRDILKDDQVSDVVLKNHTRQDVYKRQVCP